MKDAAHYADEFQLNATRALLGTHDIRKAFQNCLLFIREHIPADFLSLHLFDPGLGIYQTLVDATPDASPAVGKSTVLTAQEREIIWQVLRNLSPDPTYLIIDNLSENPMSRQLGLDLKTPNAPSLVMSLRVEGNILATTALTNTQGMLYTKQQGQLYLLLHDILCLVTSQFLKNQENKRLKESLEDKTGFLQSELLRSVDEHVVGRDTGLHQVMLLSEQVASVDAPVLLQGETGTGKEVIASAIHRMSQRRDGPFIKVNCGGIAPSLLESTLFGHEKGGFTGAHATKKGYFERAEGGTIFLDEIGELTAEAQTRFLHVLQDKFFERVGGTKTLYSDVRVIAATNKNLNALAREATFRKDLLFRLNVFPISIPPLRDRKEDIAPLTLHFLEKKSHEMGLPSIPRVAPGAIDRLMDYGWPGNVRELENVVEREIIIRQNGTLNFFGVTPEQQMYSASSSADKMTLDSAIAQHIIRALRMSGGKVEGTGGAAEILGVNPRTLQSKMTKLGVPYGRKAGDMYAPQKQH